MPDIDWNARVRAAFGPARPDEDVVEELAQHAAATYEAARAEGLPAEEAAARASAEVAAWVADGAVRSRRPRRPAAVVPPAGTRSPLAAILQDAQYALRLIRRQPAHTAIVVATMALGIAATAVLGSVVYGVLVKPLPWANGPRLVRLYESRQGATKRFGPLMTNFSYLAWRDHATTLDGMGAWSSGRMTLTGAGDPVRIRTHAVTPSLFPLLGVSPEAGRLFVEDDAQPGGPKLAILSHGLWEQRFGGQDVLGHPITLDGESYTIVGVMPKAFLFPDRETRLWTVMRVRPMLDPAHPDSISISLFSALGRLRPGATAEQATAEGTSLGRAAPEDQKFKVISMAVFGSDGAVDVQAKPLLADTVAEVRPALLILFAAVVLLLVTATANVASLQLARATGRRRELAIRAALGAGSGRLARQSLVENILLGLLGGVAGLALAWWAHRALPSVLPPDFPRLDDVAMDWRIQAFALAVSVAAGIGFGLLPSLQARRRDIVSALVEDSLAPVGGALRSRTARMRAGIMMGQVAIATVLLIGAGLLIRSFVSLMSADTGYDASGVLMAQVSLPDQSYTPERRGQLMARVLERLHAQPGVTAAAWADTAPFSSSAALSSFPLKKRDGSTTQIQTGHRWISPEYFAALGQRVIEGRTFTAADDANTQRVAIVNREFSRKYLDGKALGWALPGDKAERPIVGVVDDAIRREITDTPQPEIYSSVLQAPPDSGDLSLIVRTTGEPRQLAPALRAAVHEQDALVALDNVLTLEDLISRSIAQPRLYAIVLACFAGFALAIAAVGLFGVLSYTVAQRRREIGVRAALGATTRNIVGLVARQSLAIVAVGLAVGLLVAMWAARLLGSLLYGITTHDIASFAGVAGLLFAVAVVATLVPARRAAKVDPARVLRA
jgi:predicted permease